MDKILVSASGMLHWNDREYKCALGKGGVTEDKKEGDGATPIGCFPLREVMYRADKIGKPQTGLPLCELKKDDGWCDDVDDANYNRKVTLPYPASHESLWRDDDLYDIIVVVGYNDAPVEKGKGSAIFMHVARPTYSPTAGCIALAKDDLLEILKGVSEETQICIQQ
jgi:L,D-peptidoglycan transpeptidase YkuD (ErfK/YbiS/YcfS/YnhG family)